MEFVVIIRGNFFFQENDCIMLYFNANRPVSVVGVGRAVLGSIPEQTELNMNKRKIILEFL